MAATANPLAGITLEEAVTDPTSGLIAGPAARRLLNQRIAGTVAHHQLFTVIDLDGLKTTNDLWGHQAGDELIAQAGWVIRLHIRSDWDAYRVGGDEFVVVHDAPPEAAEAIETRLREAFDGRNGVAGSVGTADDLAVADARMYMHKAAKRQAVA